MAMTFRARLIAALHHFQEWYGGLPRKRRRTAWLVPAAIVLAVPTYLSFPQAFRNGNSETGFVIKAPEHVPVGTTFTVELHAVTTSPINAVGTVMKYDRNKLEVVTMTTANSFCSFYAENTFDTIKGEVRVSCGAPSPGFTGDSTIVQVNMRAKAVGNVEFTLSEKESHILANDGKGTDILGPITTARTSINQSL